MQYCRSYKTGAAASAIIGLAQAFSQHTPTSWSCEHSCSPQDGCWHDPIQASSPWHRTSVAQIL